MEHVSEMVFPCLLISETAESRSKTGCFFLFLMILLALIKRLLKALIAVNFALRIDFVFKSDTEQVLTFFLEVFLHRVKTVT